MSVPLSLRRVIAHREYPLYGANAEVIACLEHSGILTQILPKSLDDDQILIRALASPSYPERILCGKECIKGIWRTFVPFGPFTLLDKLAEFEFNREFYSGYRDHVTHQLKVALLGLYAYEVCEPLKRLMDGAYGDRRGFQSRWVMAALAHDLGYVFEVGDAADHDHASRIIATLNQFFRNPLREFVEWRMGNVLLPAQHEAILKALGIRSRDMTCFDDVRRAPDDTDLLDPIEGRVKGTHLSQLQKPLQTYLRYARSINPKQKQRRGFIDHGIASAYLLLSLFEGCNSWSSILRNAEYLFASDADTYQQLLTCGEEFKAIKEAVYDAAAAVSLHNIWPEIWEMDHAYRWENSRLTLNRFKIPFKALPIAGLLSMIDKIQEWDRPKFSPPAGSYDWPADVQSQDLHILPFKNGLGICYPADLLGCSGDSRSRFSELMDEMTGVIDGLLEVCPIQELSSTEVPTVLRELNWAGTFFDPSTSGGFASSSSASLKTDEGALDIAFNLYRQGRSLANNRAWLAAAECHSLAAGKFVAAGSLAWAARSLGRVAFNKLDLRANLEAQDCLIKAFALDQWQGTANYYWTVEHCARGAGDLAVARSSLEKLLRGIASLPGLEREWLALAAASPSQFVPLYEQCLVSFFEGLVAREISAGWPSWSMSDAGRLYVLRSEASPDVDDVLLEAAARVYEDTDLSSYASWCRTKANILRAIRGDGFERVSECVLAAQECVRGVIQRPGGTVDAATLASLTVSSICDVLKYVQTSEDAYLLAAESYLKDGSYSEFDPFFIQCQNIITFVGKCEGHKERPDFMPTLLSKLKHLLTDLAFYERLRSVRLVGDTLETTIAAIERVSKAGRPFDA